MDSVMEGMVGEGSLITMVKEKEFDMIMISVNMNKHLGEGEACHFEHGYF